MKNAPNPPVPNVGDFFTKDEIAVLSARSDWRGLFAVASTWAVIVATLAVLARFPRPVTFVAAVVVLGGRQLALAILQHEAAHRTLFASRFGNDVLADYACARPVGVDVARYRKHHLRHHGYTGTARDPDSSLTEPYPVRRGSLARKMARDLVGLTGLKRLFGQVLMDLEILEYTVASDVKRIPSNGRSVLSRARAFVRNAGGAMATNAVLFAACAATGHAWVYLAWAVANLTTFNLFMRIRSLAEHACKERSPNPLKNTRTTRAGLFARMTVAPVAVNHHLEHHLCASVPYYRLASMHRALRERGVVGKPPGYLDVLREVSAAPSSNPTS